MMKTFKNEYESPAIEMINFMMENIITSSTDIELPKDSFDDWMEQ